MLYKMALKIEEFDINYITAIGGKSVNGLKFATLDIKILMREAWALPMAPGGARTSSHKFP